MYMYHSKSTYSLIRSECTSSSHRRGGKEDKQVKQHDYVTSSQSDKDQHHHNTSKMSVRITVDYILVVCSQ